MQYIHTVAGREIALDESKGGSNVVQQLLEWQQHHSSESQALSSASLCVEQLLQESGKMHKSLFETQKHQEQVFMRSHILGSGR